MDERSPLYCQNGHQGHVHVLRKTKIGLFSALLPFCRTTLENGKALLSNIADRCLASVSRYAARGWAKVVRSPVRTFKLPSNFIFNWHKVIGRMNISLCIFSVIHVLKGHLEHTFKTLSPVASCAGYSILS